MQNEMNVYIIEHQKPPPPQLPQRQVRELLLSFGAFINEFVGKLLSVGERQLFRRNCLDSRFCTEILIFLSGDDNVFFILEIQGIHYKEFRYNLLKISRTNVADLTGIQVAVCCFSNVYCSQSRKVFGKEMVRYSSSWGNKWHLALRGVLFLRERGERSSPKRTREQN